MEANIELTVFEFQRNAVLVLTAKVKKPLVILTFSSYNYANPIIRAYH